MLYGNLPTPALRALCGWNDANGEYCNLSRADCLAVLNGWDADATRTTLEAYREATGPDILYSLSRRYSEMLAGAAYTYRVKE